MVIWARKRSSGLRMAHSSREFRAHAPPGKFLKLKFSEMQSGAFWTREGALFFSPLVSRFSQNAAFSSLGACKNPSRLRRLLHALGGTRIPPATRAKTDRIGGVLQIVHSVGVQSLRCTRAFAFVTGGLTAHAKRSQVERIYCDLWVRFAETEKRKKTNNNVMIRT